MGVGSERMNDRFMMDEDEDDRVVNGRSASMSLSKGWSSADDPIRIAGRETG